MSASKNIYSPMSIQKSKLGFYTLKEIKGQTYLYEITIQQGKQIWKSLGNINKLKQKDSAKLKEARRAVTSSKAKEIVENYLDGKLDKEKAKAELLKLLER